MAMTQEMRDDLRAYLRAKDELEKLYQQLRDLKLKVEPLEKQIESTVQRFGKQVEPSILTVLCFKPRRVAITHH